MEGPFIVSGGVTVLLGDNTGFPSVVNGDRDVRAFDLPGGDVVVGVGPFLVWPPQVQFPGVCVGFLVRVTSSVLVVLQGQAEGLLGCLGQHFSVSGESLLEDVFSDGCRVWVLFWQVVGGSDDNSGVPGFLPHVCFQDPETQE